MFSGKTLLNGGKSFKLNTKRLISCSGSDTIKKNLTQTEIYEMSLKSKTTYCSDGYRIYKHLCNVQAFHWNLIIWCCKKRLMQKSD